MLLDVLGLERASSMLAWSILSSHAVQALVEVDVVRSTSGQPYSLSANHPLRGLDDHLHGKGEGQRGDCAAGHDSYLHLLHAVAYSVVVKESWKARRSQGEMS